MLSKLEALRYLQVRARARVRVRVRVRARVSTGATCGRLGV